ncbi:PREDICTED: WD repeat-containing protein 18 [Vollenhovia emeryi]|uniref:WD repeat-containing protein 18 n=1 Tax=Vollenhovia emeryi TaxID=411798 RepID=UPI0005F5539A|nr:PREDICTED: WD repeat-containing protein 18 [Vollenhovia emeryi]XP_011864980.1 PREDICTED: WD repeat-containing protein 18 [Vollenhovia emeryi]XP_011864981.1 PREDICTED: WD repeat-containing protein 18 [Vollenhovia emeryi]
MQRLTDAREVILTSDSSGESWSAAVWDPRNGALLSMYKNATALGHRSLQLLSDSYVLGADATRPRVHVWALNNPSPLPNIRLTTPGKVSALACTPNGSYIIASVGEKLFVWQTCNGRLLANLTRHYQTVGCLATTRDGSLFASAGEDGLVFVWSLYGAINDARCSPVHAFSNHSLPVKDLCFGHGDARARLYTVSLDRTASIYELGSGALLVSLVFDAPLTAVAVNVRESELFVGCTTGEIFQCDLHEPPRGVEHHVTVGSGKVDEESAAFRAHKSNVTALSVSVDCRTLLSGSTDGAVHVWDVASRQVLKTLEHKGPVTAAFFARGFDNFRAPVLKPRLQVHNLQRTSDDGGRESVVEVVARGRNPAEILNFEAYTESSGNSLGSDEMSSKLEDLQKEILRLKKINTAMYRYGVTHILNKIDDD